jgi:hypothetical protein
MVKGRNLFLIALAVLAATGTAMTLMETETRRVKKSFHRLSEWVSKEGEENPLSMARKARDLGSLFAEKCEFKTPVDPLSGTLSPEEISGLAMRGRALFSFFEVRFYDLKIEIRERDTAHVDLTAMAKGRMTNGETIQETHEIACILKKIDKRWLFSRFEVVEVLKK